MKVLDLFSGIGGFSLGLERAGMETVAFCEIDEHCHKVLKKHWPSTPIMDDVSKVDGYTLNKLLGGIDVICGGFPCQDISVAGKQKGLIDESGNTTRSGLWFQYKRLIDEIRPRYVIIENVANLRGNGLVTVLQDLWTLGYDAEWHIIPACALGGEFRAPHRRERIWIVAYASGERWGQRACENLELKIQKERGEKSSNACKKENAVGSDGNAADSDSERWGKVGVLGDMGGKENKKGKRGNQFAQTSFDSCPDAADTYGERLGGVQPGRSSGEDWPEKIRTGRISKEWFASNASSFNHQWQVESSICRMDDGLSAGLYESERFRKQRIKQLGNSIVPQIAELLGKAIMYGME